MILPVMAYGEPVLKKKATEINADYENLKQLIADMWETMYHANGVGLAAPQIGKSIRLFVVDASPFNEDEEHLKDFKKVFINAQMLEEKGEEWAFSEGCLSIPGIRGDVMRKGIITMRYMDENFVEHTESFGGIAARIIQHEYDHTEGILFIERISPIKRTLIKGKLADIQKGKVDVDYKMRFKK
jgi:peptide deformylase